MACRTRGGKRKKEKKKQKKKRSRAGAVMDLLPIWYVLMNEKIFSREGHDRIEFSLYSSGTRNDKTKERKETKMKTK